MEYTSDPHSHPRCVDRAERGVHRDGFEAVGVVRASRWRRRSGPRSRSSRSRAPRCAATARAARPAWCSAARCAPRSVMPSDCVTDRRHPVRRSPRHAAGNCETGRHGPSDRQDHPPRHHLEIEYETFGSPDDPALLLVMGFAGPADRLGVRVLRAARRPPAATSSASTTATAACRASSTAQRRRPRRRARRRAVAAAAAGGALHAVATWPTTASACSTPSASTGPTSPGASMGGMIAQTMAHRAPGPGAVAHVDHELARRSARRQADAGGARRCCWRRRRPTATRYVDQAAKTHGVGVEALLRRRRASASGFGRVVRPQLLPRGAPRQLAAIYASGDRTARLGELDVPTLVIHGRDDTLITPDGGERHRGGDPRRPPAAARRHGPRPAARRCGRSSSAP